MVTHEWLVDFLFDSGWFDPTCVVQLQLARSHGLEQGFSTWGTCTPRGTSEGHKGYMRRSQGYAKLKKNHSNEAYFNRFYYLGVATSIQILIGGTQTGTIFIWGYMSTKRLRTLGLEQCF